MLTTLKNLAFTLEKLMQKSFLSLQRLIHPNAYSSWMSVAQPGMIRKKYTFHSSQFGWIFLIANSSRICLGWFGNGTHFYCLNCTLAHPFWELILPRSNFSRVFNWLLSPQLFSHYFSIFRTEMGTPSPLLPSQRTLSSCSTNWLESVHCSAYYFSFKMWAWYFMALP